MIKTVVKLAIVALIVNASWQLFNAYWPYYKFKDAVNFTTQYRADQSDDEIRARILELAEQLDLPVTDDNLQLRRQDKHTIVDISYVKDIDLAPSWKYPWPFTVHVDTYTVKPPTADELLAK
jgi:hypothetical protein